MKPAGSITKLAWACGGDIIIAHWGPDGRPGVASIADASDLHTIHRDAMVKAAECGSLALHDYHYRWERALREAIAERSLQRRASGGLRDISTSPQEKGGAA